jgi:hypothetical protein
MNSLATPDVLTKPTAGVDSTQNGLPVRILALCAIAFLLAWLPRLYWGFWTDEAGTFWMVCKGWREALNRTAAWPGQSITYSVLESFLVSGGLWKEPLLRVPSVLAIAVAAWQLKRVAELVIDRNAGWLAVVPFVCAPEIVNSGTSARPYTLALAASLASFRYLLEWQESRDRKTAAKYLIASVLTLYLHYLFGFIFIIQAAYLAFCQVRGRRIGLGLPLAAAILLPASMLPLLGVLRSSAHQAGSFAHAVRPTLLQLLQACFPPAVLLGTGLGLLLLFVSARNPRWRPTPLRPEFAFLIATWMTLGPIAFFVIAHFTDQSVFATRYLLFAFPAFVLLVVWVMSGLERAEWRFLILMAIFAGTVLHPGNLLLIFRGSPASWREPLRLIASQSEPEAPPVFVASGLVESGSLRWAEADPATSRLFAALTAYPLRNRTIPLPYQFDEHVKDFIRDNHLAEYKSGQRCFLLAASGSELASWMASYMAQIGFHAVTHQFNDFVVLQFRRD